MDTTRTGKEVSSCGDESPGSQADGVCPWPTVTCVRERPSAGWDSSSGTICTCQQLLAHEGIWAPDRCNLLFYTQVRSSSSRGLCSGLVVLNIDWYHLSTASHVPGAVLETTVVITKTKYPPNSFNSQSNLARLLTVVFKPPLIGKETEVIEVKRVPHLESGSQGFTPTAV